MIDLTDERGYLAGFMLAQLGAEVILVEPSEGSRSRRVGPWLSAGPRTLSIGHWYYSLGKRSVTLDYDRSSGDLDRLRELIAHADVLIDSFEPGRPSRLGLTSETLEELNPRLVHASITPFGSTGPRASSPATDLTAWAATMALRLTGDADRVPVRVGGVPQAFLHAAADAVCGVLIALHERRRSGRGQRVDASAQVSGLAATQSLVLSAPYRSIEPTRMGGGVTIGMIKQQLIWECADGYVAITLVFTGATAAFNARLMAWLAEEGLCSGQFASQDWAAFGDALTREEPAVAADYELIKELVSKLVGTRTKAELLVEAHRRKVLLAPLNAVPDIVEMDHLAARGYWTEVRDARLATHRFVVPGPFARLSETPLRRLTSSPSIGEANAELLGSSRDQRSARPTASGGSTSSAALHGLKVVDLMWVVAGPTITRALADFGATVVRIETSKRVDTARTVRPYLDDVPDPERAGSFCNLNAGKFGMRLDVTHVDGRAVFEDLVRWADVVTESFAPGVIDRWGYGYERLRELNPRVVMLSTSLMGQTGPLATFAGFGSLAASLVGFSDLTGWPDRPPSGPFAAYTDYVAPRFGLAALLAALEVRERIGVGQHIDLAQAEAAFHFLGPAVAAWTAAGVRFERCGNNDPDMAPHGVYPCRGPDEFVAIACQGDAQWTALRALIGAEDEACDSGWDFADNRRRDRVAIDAIVSRWTCALPADTVASLCARAGVAAQPVLDSAGCFADDQLRHRRHFQQVPHAIHGSVLVEGPRVTLSRTPGRVGAAPTLGEHSSFVLSDLLGYDAAEIARLDATGGLR